MAFNNLSAKVQQNLKRTLATAGAKIGASALRELNKIANRNVDASRWVAGEEFVVPNKETLTDSIFVTPIAGSEVPAAGVTVETTTGAAKNLFFSTLRKSAVEYNDELVPGQVHQSNTPLADQARECGTAEDLFNLLVSNEGKTIKVLSVENVKTARWKDGVPVGTRNTTIPYFDVM